MNLQEIIHRLETIYQQTDYNGSYALVTADKILAKKNYGFAKFKEKQLFTEATQSCIGSVTKQFTGTACMILHEQGKLNLEMPVVAFFPDLLIPKAITVKHLLTMSSGLPDYQTELFLNSLKKIKEQRPELNEKLQEFYAEFATAEQISFNKLKTIITTKPMDFQVGTRVSYSNTNYYLLGLIIEKVSGLSFEKFVTQKILSPLSMVKTSFATQNSIARSYRNIDNELHEFPNTYQLLSADGCMVSTINDLSKWLQAVLKGEILSPESWDQVFNLYLKEYNCGWMKLGDWFYHGGQYLGFYCEIFLHRKAGLGKVMLYNREATSELDQYSMDERSNWRNLIRDWSFSQN